MINEIQNMPKASNLCESPSNGLFKLTIQHLKLIKGCIIVGSIVTSVTKGTVRYLELLQSGKDRVR